MEWGYIKLSRKTRGNLLLLLTAFIWGTAFVAQVSGMEEIQAFTFNFSRNVVAGISLLILIKIWPYIIKSPLVETQEMKKPTVIGGIVCGFVLTLAMSFQQLGLSGPYASTAGKAGFITALYIVLVPLLGIFIGKKISLRIWMCVFLAAIGLYLLSIQQGFTIQLGDLLVLICAFFYALHILVVDHFSPKSNGVKMSMIQFFVAAILSGIVMLAIENFTWESVLKSSIPILYTGMISSGVGFTLQIVAQKDTDPTMASLIMSLESVFAVLAGALILGETLSLREALGCIIMFIALVLAQMPSKEERILSKERRRQKKEIK